jgi:hypothetical protein
MFYVDVAVDMLIVVDVNGFFRKSIAIATPTPMCLINGPGKKN